MEQIEQTTEQTTEQQPVNLSLQDLLMVTQILQVVAQRGAIRADEMTNVGGLYERLIAFLTASGAINTQESQSEEEQSQADGTVVETPDAGE